MAILNSRLSTFLQMISVSLNILEHPRLLLHDGHHVGVLLLEGIEDGLDLEKYFQEGTVKGFIFLALSLYHVGDFINEQLQEVNMTFL